MGLRNIISAVAVTGLGLALAAPADAQEVLTREESTLELVIGGEVRMGYVYRGEMFDAVFPRNGLPATGRRSAKNETFSDLQTSIFLDFTLKERVGVLVELTTGADPFAGEAHRFGDNFQQVEFEQVKIYAEDLLVDRFRMSVGVQRLKSEYRNERGHGQFFLDVHNSENPFTGAVHNWSTTGGAANGTPSQANVSWMSCPPLTGPKAVVRSAALSARRLMDSCSDDGHNQIPTATIITTTTHFLTIHLLRFYYRCGRAIQGCPGQSSKRIKG